MSRPSAKYRREKKRNCINQEGVESVPVFFCFFFSFFVVVGFFSRQECKCWIKSTRMRVTVSKSRGSFSSSPFSLELASGLALEYGSGPLQVLSPTINDQGP